MIPLKKIGKEGHRWKTRPIYIGVQNVLAVKNSQFKK